MSTVKFSESAAAHLAAHCDRKYVNLIHHGGHHYSLIREKSVSYWPAQSDRPVYIEEREEPVLNCTFRDATTLAIGGKDAERTIQRLDACSVTTRTRRKRLMDGQGGLCFYCRRLMQFEIPEGEPKELLATTEHVIPLSKGGTETEDNVVASCWECNQKKSDKLLEECPEIYERLKQEGRLP